MSINATKLNVQEINIGSGATGVTLGTEFTLTFIKENQIITKENAPSLGVSFADGVTLSDTGIVVPLKVFTAPDGGASGIYLLYEKEDADTVSLLLMKNNVISACNMNI